MDMGAYAALMYPNVSQAHPQSVGRIAQRFRGPHWFEIPAFATMLASNKEAI